METFDKIHELIKKIIKQEETFYILIFRINEKGEQGLSYECHLISNKIHRLKNKLRRQMGKYLEEQGE